MDLSMFRNASVLGALVVLAACGSDGGGGGEGHSGCIPNSTNACLGPNGCSGVQTCTAQGAYTECVCGTAGSSGGLGGQGGSGAQPSGSGGSSGSGGASGGGSGGSSGAPSCQLSFSDATCDSCFQNECQNQCATCSGNADCVSLIECIDSCSTSSCIDSCHAAFPTGKTAFEAVVACAMNETLCGPVCDTGRQIGYACNHDYQCASGECAGTDPSNGFCTMVCSSSNACGDYAWCMPNSAGYTSCFPVCEYSSDCAYLGSGYSCQKWTNKEGYAVWACAK